LNLRKSKAIGEETAGTGIGGKYRTNFFIKESKNARRLGRAFFIFWG
jgi:hypothetical protein